VYKEEIWIIPNARLLVCHDDILCVVQNVNVMLEQHMTENAEVALTLSRLTEERQRLQARVKELEEQLSTALVAKVNKKQIIVKIFHKCCTMNEKRILELNYT
jgi:UDP-2,3-diacylglucosamine pyrophosphatase LpxH